MSEVTMTWQEFLHEASEFLNLSNRLNDTWLWQQKNDDEGSGFLVYKQKIPRPKQLDGKRVQQSSESCSTEKADDIEDCSYRNLLQVEYHVVYSISYQVPVLYFSVHKNDGSILDLEEAWSIFQDYGAIDTQISEDNRNQHDQQHQLYSSKSRSDMLSILSQMDHPVLCRPFLALHPCQTAKLLAQNGVSRNRILTFISLMGPFVQIQLPNEYGLEN